MGPDRRFLATAAVGLALIAAAAASDFLIASFWQDHTLLTALVANLLVVAITVVVINELIERRDRKRWNMLAQNVLFSLVQTARATWTGLVELVELGEVESGSEESIRRGAELARNTEALSEATWEMLGDGERRAHLQKLTGTLSEHASRVIADWAPVMVGARAYAGVLDRHVELAGRLEWLASVLTHNEPVERQSRRERRFTTSNIAVERAEELGSDDWLHDQVMALIALGVELDESSREHAYSLVPVSRWAERTHGLAASGE